jgi:hypothetical protein
MRALYQSPQKAQKTPCFAGFCGAVQRRARTDLQPIRNLDETDNTKSDMRRR